MALTIHGMIDEQTGDDMRLVSTAYAEFFIRGDKASMRELERDARPLARAVGGLAFFLMDAVYIPVVHHIGWADSWVAADFQKRCDPEFRATLVRRGRLRRMANGYTLRPKTRSRQVVRDISKMLLMAYVDQHDRVPKPCQRDEAALEILAGFRERLCQTGDGERNA